MSSSLASVFEAAARRPLGNYSLFVDAPYKIQIRSAPEPEPLGPHDCLVEMSRIGICGSDVHIWKGEIRTTFPSALGHEGAGIVKAVGSSVTDVKPGDRVALEPVSKPRFQSGMVSRFFIIPAAHCYKLADNVTMEEAAFVEPFAVALHGAVRGNVGTGSRVLVLGAGPIGLNAILASKALGASWVGVTDINPKRLEVAKKLTGVDSTFLTLDLAPRAAATMINSQLSSPPPIVLDAAGFIPSIETALRVADNGGTIVLIGVPPSNLSSFLVGALLDKELDFRGSYCYGGHGTDYAKAFNFINTRQVDVRPMITNLVGLEDVDNSFKVSAAGGDTIKVMFNLPELGKPAVL